MDFFANLSLIISAIGMIALAILTRRSVLEMEKTVSIMQKDSVQRTRPFVYIDEDEVKLIVSEETVRVDCVVDNCGVSPALIDTFGVLLNGERYFTPEEIETAVPLVAFPKGKSLGLSFRFNRADVRREDWFFRIEMRVEYYSVGFEEIRYVFTNKLDLYGEDDEEGGIKIVGRFVRQQSTT